MAETRGKDELIRNRPNMWLGNRGGQRPTLWASKNQVAEGKGD